jgi:hypothetical protein
VIVHHPAAAMAGTRRRALTQTTDLVPTILDIFGIGIPEETRGHVKNARAHPRSVTGNCSIPASARRSTISSPARASCARSRDAAIERRIHAELPPK